MASITTIQETDVASNSRSVINDNFSNLNNDKIETSVISTDTDLGGTSASDSKLSTQKAVREFVVATASPTGKSWNEYAIANSGTDAYTISVPGVTSYVVGQTFKVQPDVSNTDSCTLNVNGLGALPIKKTDGNDTQTGDIIAGRPFIGTYDGINIQLVSFVPSQSPTSLPISANGGLVNHSLSSSGNTVIAHGIGSIPKIVKIKGIVDFNITQANNTGAPSWAEALAISGTIVSQVSVATSINSNNGYNFAKNEFKLYESATQPANEVSKIGTITIDATNITISWTKIENNGTLSKTARITWEAIK